MPWMRVWAAFSSPLNQILVRRMGGKVIAVGTTVVRALDKLRDKRLATPFNRGPALPPKSS